MGVRESSALVCTLVVLAASIGAANAAVPTFPDNIVAFPQRDFVTLEGYSELKGQKLIVEVVRAGVVIGSAIGVVSGGEVAFEVNHPGGYCWGAGTGLDVTPDIKHGDMVQLRKADLPDSDFFQDMVVKHAECSGPGEITTDKLSVAGSNSDDNVVTITGVYSGSVSLDNMEQRVVNPDLKDTDVGRRDVRAVRAVGGLFEASDGYSSKLDFDEKAGTFTATYVFTNDAVTQGAPKIMISGGGERLLSWMAVDGGANRQGITIAELGESGGPGLGGCPPGPKQTAPPAGSYTNASLSDTIASVMWTPQTAGADADPVTGYFVSATLKAPPSGADYLKTGPMKIVNGATAKNCSMPVDKGFDYEFEVRSLSGDGAGLSPYKFSAPFKYQPPAKTQAPVPDGTVGTAPLDVVVKMANTPTEPATHGQITLTSPDAKSEIYWNIDGPAAVGGSTALDATLYSGPFFPPADFVNGKEHVIHWVVYVTPELVAGQTEPGPEVSKAGKAPEAFTFPSVGPPKPRDSITYLPYTSTSDGFKVEWKYTTADAGLKTFRVEVYDKTTSEPIPSASIKDIGPNERSAFVTGLPTATTVQYAVIPEPAAVNAVHARADAKSLPVVKISITGATWKSGDLRWVVNAPAKMDVTLYGGSATAPNLSTSIFSLPTSSALWTAPVSPATSWTADCRVRTGTAATTNPNFIWGVYAGGAGQEKGVIAAKGRKLRL